MAEEELLLELDSSVFEEVLLLFLEEETGAGLEEEELELELEEVLVFSELLVTLLGADVESLPLVQATMQSDIKEIINPFCNFFIKYLTKNQNNIHKNQSRFNRFFYRLFLKKPVMSRCQFLNFIDSLGKIHNFRFIEKLQCSFYAKNKNISIFSCKRLLPCDIIFFSSTSKPRSRKTWALSIRLYYRSAP